MKLFVKQDGGFRLIGEGKIYKKANLKLNEDITATTNGATNVAQAQKEAQKTMNQNSNVSGVTTDAGHLDQQQDTNSGEGQKLQLPVNASASEISNAQKLANQSGNDDMSIEFVGKKQQLNNSRKINKNLTESRKNVSVFSKRELAKLLKKY